MNVCLCKTATKHRSPKKALKQIIAAEKQTLIQKQVIYQNLDTKIQ